MKRASKVQKMKPQRPVAKGGRKGANNVARPKSKVLKSK